MMREIKFRAWFKNEIWEVWRLEWWKGVINNASLSRSPSMDYWYSSTSTNDIAFMQYTGLKDSEGKEIYEGDIIKSGRTSLNYQVVWDNEDAARFIGVCVEPDKNFVLEPYSWCESEVIGNIYESPELLETP